LERGRILGKVRLEGPPRKRRVREIEYYVVVEGSPNPEVLLQNYIWCLKQREAVRLSDLPSENSSD
jgi:hypothetical protein